MNKIRNIIFDFDGTLSDTAPVIVATMQKTIKHLELPSRSDDDCRWTIGIKLEDVPAVLWPELDNESTRIFAPTFRRVFNVVRHQIKADCFPGVISVLHELHERGFRMAVATSRSRQSLEEYVAEYGIADLFDMLIGGNDVMHGKPSPEPVLKILEARSWQAAETITVGDAPVDIQMGKAAGTQTCAVTYGNGRVGELEAAAPDYVIDSFAELALLVGN